MFGAHFRRHCWRSECVCLCGAFVIRNCIPLYRTHTLCSSPPLSASAIVVRFVLFFFLVFFFLLFIFFFSRYLGCTGCDNNYLRDILRRKTFHFHELRKRARTVWHNGETTSFTLLFSAHERGEREGAHI